MDIKRIISALLGFPLVVIVLLIGNKIVVDVVLAVIAFISMNEYFNAVSKISQPVKWIGYLSCAGIGVIHLIPENYITPIALIYIPTLILILFLKVIVTDMKTTFKDIAYTLFGILYVVAFIMFIALIHGMENGKLLVWYAIFAAWGTDVAAYVVGKYFGKHKFSKVSPKKSIEGCIGGTITAIIIILIYTFIVNKYLNVGFSYLYFAGVGLVLSLIGQIGDFSASSIKRFVEIKDYSNLIPGHGGMLDRIDSLIFIAPFAYALFTIL